MPHGRMYAVVMYAVMDLLMKGGTIKGTFDIIQSEDFDRILQLFAQGTFQPVVDAQMPLSDARLAHERIEARRNFGKIVLIPPS